MFIAQEHPNLRMHRFAKPEPRSEMPVPLQHALPQETAGSEPDSQLQHFTMVQWILEVSFPCAWPADDATRRAQGLNRSMM